VDPGGGTRTCSAGASCAGRGYLVPFHAALRVHARPVRRLLERGAPRTLPAPKLSFFRILPTLSVVLYRDSPIDYPSKDAGQNSKKLNSFFRYPLDNTPPKPVHTCFQLVQHERSHQGDPASRDPTQGWHEPHTSCPLSPPPSRPRAPPRPREGPQRARLTVAKRAANAPATCTAAAHVRSARSLSYAAEPCCAGEWRIACATAPS
jgi:hypothetical protein